LYHPPISKEIKLKIYVRINYIVISYVTN